ncbi:MAG TPA: hypothetical protein VNK23_12510 [Candidatus Dormibacteraeota bacterium]|nr:hypothetical protein [Candidatus Dormibacteraeota bacterium]
MRDGIVSYSGARHTTIGFPRTGGAWQAPESAYHSGPARTGAAGAGAPLSFAGQGRAIWQASPRRGATGTKSAAVRMGGEWNPPGHRGERGDRERFGRGYADHDRDRRRFRGAYYPYGGYPYGAYGIYPWIDFGESGFGNWLNCDQWTPDWDWQDEGCENNQQQIVAYGADGVYPAPQTVTDERLEEYIRQHPWIGDGTIASAPSERRPSNSDSASDQILQSSSARSDPAPETLLYLSDGTNFEVTSYWLAGGEMHYVTSYGGENAVPIGKIDLQRTVNANATRGVAFTLRPAPQGGSEAAR